MQTLVRYIYSKGHRKIAYIYGDPSSVTSIRLDSYRKTLESLNIKIREDYLLQGKYHDPKETEKLAGQLVSMSEPPTCIILPDDFSAMGALTAFEKLGMSVPDDISVAGYDGITLSQVVNPKLTTFRQNTEKLGEESAKRLISLIAKEDIPDDGGIVSVEGRLLEGASVKDLS
jgi:DNA-binding LacI/PurR family transcriptional regulator